MDPSDYDPRYLAGILFFNEGDYFEAHEVWEDLWAESYGDDHRFVQGLIQVAVGLFHFHGGNARGARKLYTSSQAYMEGLDSPYWGIDLDGLWECLHRCFAEVVKWDDVGTPPRPDPDDLPTLELDPSPTAWPDPEAYLEDEDD